MSEDHIYNIQVAKKEIHHHAPVKLSSMEEFNQFEKFKIQADPNSASANPSKVISEDDIWGGPLIPAVLIQNKAKRSVRAKPFKRTILTNIHYDEKENKSYVPLF